MDRGCQLVDEGGQALSCFPAILEEAKKDQRTNKETREGWKLDEARGEEGPHRAPLGVQPEGESRLTEETLSEFRSLTSLDNLVSGPQFPRL